MYASVISPKFLYCWMLDHILCIYKDVPLQLRLNVFSHISYLNTRSVVGTLLFDLKLESWRRFCNTHHINKDVLHHVFFYVFLNFMPVGMCCYIFHIYKDVHQYVFYDKLVKELCDWIG